MERGGRCRTAAADAHSTTLRVVPVAGYLLGAGLGLLLGLRLTRPKPAAA